MKRGIFVLFAILLLTLPLRADESSLEIFDKLKSLIISVSDSIKPAVVHIEVVKKKRDQRAEDQDDHHRLAPLRRQKRYLDVAQQRR